MDHQGAKVSVWLKTGDTVEGWIYGQSKLGLYIATDPAANFIRFIPHNTYERSLVDISEKVQFPSVVNDIYRSTGPEINVDEFLTRELVETLNQIDYNRIRRIRREYDALEAAFDGAYDTLHLSDSVLKSRVSLLEIALRLRANHVELIAESDRCGLSSILLERADQIRELLALGNLPIFEFEMVSPDKVRLLEEMIYVARETNYVSETEMGKKKLDELSVDKLALNIGNDEPEVLSREAMPQEPSRWPQRMKYMAALGKVAVGGGLAAANITAGIFAGVVGSLPTLAVGTVAGAVGVATSAYTGLNAACDGLKDLAIAIETRRDASLR